MICTIFKKVAVEPEWRSGRDIFYRLAMWQDNWYRFLYIVQPFPGILVSLSVHRLCILVRTYQFFSALLLSLVLAYSLSITRR